MKFREALAWLSPAAFAQTVAPEDVWPDAVRMTVAAVASFAACRALDLHGGFFAVLTALLTTRPSNGGGRAVFDRVFGMAMGVVVGLSLVWVQRYHVPQLALVAIAMVPLCYAVARFRKYQAAPITAILVLSAGSMVRFALHSAMLRVMEVCIGGAIGFVVSLIVFRRTTDRRSRQHTADLLRGCGLLITNAIKGIPARHDLTLRQRLRGDLRLVAVTSRALPSRGRRLGRTQIAALTSLLQDLISLGRALAELKLPWRARARPVLARLADSFQLLCLGAADAILSGDPSPDFGAFDAALQALRDLSVQRGMPRGNDATAAMPYLLLRLRTDLHEVLEGHAGAPAGGDIELEAEPDPASGALVTIDAD